jgi:hypothetical protein
MQAEPNFCLLFNPFASRGCLCYQPIRASMVATYGSTYVDTMGSLAFGCGLPEVLCITETAFCPIADGTNGTVTLDAAAGLYTVSYSATLPGTYSVGVKASLQVNHRLHRTVCHRFPRRLSHHLAHCVAHCISLTVSPTASPSLCLAPPPHRLLTAHCAASAQVNTTVAGARRLTAMVTESLSNSPTAHKAQPGEPAAASSVMAMVQSPQEAAAYGAELTVSLTDVYGNAAYLGGDAFYLVPQIRSVPLGSQPPQPYTTPAEQETTTYAAALQAGGSDPIEIYYDGFQISDMLTGSYTIRVPATVPGSYSLVVFIADACDYRGHVAALAAGEQNSTCALNLLSEAMVQVTPRACFSRHPSPLTGSASTLRET